MNVLELTIKNMEFSFHFLCTLMCPGSVKHSSHFYPGLRKMAYLLFPRAVP